jgi:hypothetical protein
MSLPPNPASDPPPPPPPGSGPGAEQRQVVPPRPPPLPLRIVLLIVQPEQWAHAALYRYSATFWPLLWVLVITSTIVALATGSRILDSCRTFARSYDHRYQPMLLKNGELSVIPQKGLKPLSINGKFARLMVRPQAQGSYTNTSRRWVFVITHGAVVLTGSWFSKPIVWPLLPLQESMAKANGAAIKRVAGQPRDVPPVRIDSATLEKFLQTYRPALLTWFAILGGAIIDLRQAFWCLLMIVLTGPLVMILNRNLGMPLRVAYRIGTAVLAPVLALQCLLIVLRVLPLESQSTLVETVLFFSPVLLAVWAGVLANRMFHPRA